MRTHFNQLHWPGELTGILFITLLLSTAMFTLTFASASQAQLPTPPVDPVVASTEPYVEYAPNTALIKFKAGVALAVSDVTASGADVATNAASLNGLLSALGVTSARPLFAGDGDVLAAQSRGRKAGRAGAHLPRAVDIDDPGRARRGRAGRRPRGGVRRAGLHRPRRAHAQRS